VLLDRGSCVVNAVKWNTLGICITFTGDAGSVKRCNWESDKDSEGMSQGNYGRPSKDGEPWKQLCESLVTTFTRFSQLEGAGKSGRLET
jgi:hypothetical protein